jgi:hypothetical protein
MPWAPELRGVLLRARASNKARSSRGKPLGGEYLGAPARGAEEAVKRREARSHKHPNRGAWTPG